MRPSPEEEPNTAGAQPRHTWSIDIFAVTSAQSHFLISIFTPLVFRIFPPPSAFSAFFHPHSTMITIRICVLYLPVLFQLYIVLKKRVRARSHLRHLQLSFSFPCIVASNCIFIWPSRIKSHLNFFLFKITSHLRWPLLTFVDLHCLFRLPLRLPHVFHTSRLSVLTSSSLIFCFNFAYPWWHWNPSTYTIETNETYS